MYLPLIYMMGDWTQSVLIFIENGKVQVSKFSDTE